MYNYQDFYKLKDFKYPEIAILMDDITKENNKGRFIIPTLTPSLPTERISRSTMPKFSTSNIINNTNMSITEITEQNYVTLSVPKYLFIDDIPYKEGDKFIVVFVAGDINKIRVIGVY